MSLTPLGPAGLTYYTKRKLSLGAAFAWRRLIVDVLGDRAPDTMQMLFMCGISALGKEAGVGIEAGQSTPSPIG